MKCNKCGTLVSDNDKFCGFCGTVIDNNPEQSQMYSDEYEYTYQAREAQPFTSAPPYPPVSVPAPPTTDKVKKRNDSIIAALIAVMIIMVLAVGGIFVYQNVYSGKSSDNGSNTVKTASRNTNTETDDNSEDTNISSDGEISDTKSDNDEKLIDINDGNNYYKEDDYTYNNSERNNHVPADAPVKDEVYIPAAPEPTPPPTPPSNPGLDKKNSYLARANEIQTYQQNYLSNATSQTSMNTESSVVFQKWDGLLNEVYQYLKSTMPAAQFKQLEKEEIEWIKHKEASINAAGSEYAGGSMEPYARNIVAIDYTEQRCFYLISLIN